MVDFNVVVTLRGRDFSRALNALRAFGRVRRTRFYNVVVLKVEDPQAFLEKLRERFEQDEQLRGWLARAEPLARTFELADPDELDERCKEAIAELLPELDGKSFHVRVHPRGLRERISGQEEERKLDTWLIERSESEKVPARVRFDDPDLIVDVETVGKQAGLSAWTREELHRFPFLHLD